MIGPACPGSPLGETKALRHNVMAQDYDDGTLYQLSVPRGAGYAAFPAAMGALPHAHINRAVWSTVHAPWDIGDDDDRLYLSLWVACE